MPGGPGHGGGLAPAPADGSGHGFRRPAPASSSTTTTATAPARLPAPAPASRRRPRSRSGRRPGGLDPVPAPASGFRESVSNTIQHDGGGTVSGSAFRDPSGLLRLDGFRLLELPALPGVQWPSGGFRDPSGPGGVGTSPGFQLSGKVFQIPFSTTTAPEQIGAAARLRPGGWIRRRLRPRLPASSSTTTAASRSGPETADFFGRGFILYL